MRITIPIDIWDPSRGGLERYLSLLCDSLRVRGHEVTVLCTKSLKDASRESGPTIQVLDVPGRPRWLRELRFAQRTIEVHRASGAEILFAVRHALEADIYQPHGGSYRSAVKTALIGRSAPVRAMKTLLRFLRPTHHALSWLDGEVFRRSPSVVTLSLSRVVEESLETAFPGQTFRFERIYNGIPLESFHDRDRQEQHERLRERYGIPQDAKVALFLAHQFRAKGLAVAIRALSVVAGWHLIVGGRGRPAPFRRQARNLFVEDRVHFPGPIADVRAAYAGADAFVLPTTYDSCSLSVLESIACGTPVITTRQNGASELIEDGREGFVLASPGDEKGLARGMREIASQREEFHARCLEVAPRFSWELHVDRVVAAIERRAEELE